MATVKVYRIRDETGILGVVAATSSEVAQAYAIGKYGASSNVERVSVQQALGLHGLCIILETELKHNGLGDRPSRIISQG